MSQPPRNAKSAQRVLDRTDKKDNEEIGKAEPLRQRIIRRMPESVLSVTPEVSCTQRRHQGLGWDEAT